VLGDRAELVGSLDAVLPVDIRIPGCPPTPAEIAEHLLAGLTPG
jgi:Ni,Fe-hydrogenase III small subunit